MERSAAAPMSGYRPFTVLAAAILALIGFAHALRFFAGWEIVIVGVVIPVWLSAPVAVIFLAVAAMVWREARV